MIKKGLLLIALISATLVMTVSVMPAMATTADSTGLTAKIVATTNQVIKDKTINATGYDIGVYVGPGVTGVVIKNVKIFGANDHGIYIEDTSGIVVKNSVITGNGVAPHSGLTEDKAITLAGTRNVLIQNNNVSFNLADGGISVIDDGPINPAQPNPGSPHKSVGNMVIGNLINDNLYGCGIVVSGKNPGEGVSYNMIIGNTIIGNSPGPNPMYIGGIVVAGFNVTNNAIIDNVVKGGWIAGINVHSSYPGDIVSGTAIIGNKLENNTNIFAPGTAGIELVALGGVLKNTLVIGNTVNNDHYGVWHINDVNSFIVQKKGNAVVQVAP